MKMTSLVWIAVIALVVIAGWLLLSDNRQVQPGVGGGPAVISEQDRMEFNLDATDKDQFDQSGKATLEENNGRVRVTLAVNQVEGLNNQPAHIHLGSCPDVGEVTFPLNNVVDGKSVTEISITLDSLRSSQSPMAINIHKSAEESNVYTACGNLPR